VPPEPAEDDRGDDDGAGEDGRAREDGRAAAGAANGSGLPSSAMIAWPVTHTGVWSFPRE
jgi:hypothetical protein